MSDRGIATLKSLEGLRLQPYKDGKGYSIGYGHFIQRGEEWMMNGITQQQAETIFDDDLQFFETVVNDTFYNSAGDAYSVGLDQNLFDALVMFAYNIGGNDFQDSQLVKMIMAGAGAKQVHDFWITTWIGSPVNPKLVIRRHKEADYAFPATTAKKGSSGWLLVLLGGYIIYKSSN